MPSKGERFAAKEVCLSLVSLSSGGAGSPSQLRGNLCNHSIFRKEVSAFYQSRRKSSQQEKMHYSHGPSLGCLLKKTKSHCKSMFTC